MRRAVSRTVIAAVVVVVVIVAGVGAYFALGLGMGGNNSTTPSTNTTTTGNLPPSGSLSNSVNKFILDFNARDVASIKGFFTDSSVIVWSGAAGGLQGTYNGIDGAGIVYATSVGGATALTAKASNLQNTSTGPTTATVTYHMNITGNSHVVGPFNSTADVNQKWSYQGGAWTIQNDNWNYISFVSTNQGGATVFPQWSLALNGKPPSLAQEHVLEWNVAPFMAIGVYVAIVGLGLSLIWVGTRKQKR